MLKRGRQRVHFLAAYCIQVRDKRLTHLPSDSRYARLDQVGGKHSLQAIVEAFAGENIRMTPVRSTTANRVFRIASCDGADQVRYGWIELGDVGLPGRIVNTETEETAYLKSAVDSDIASVFYYIHVPQESNKALIFFHMANGRSCKKLLETQLRKYLKSEHGVALEISAVCNESLLKSWMDAANVSEIRIRQKSGKIGSVDVADGLDSRAQVTSVIKSTVRSGRLMSLWDAIKGPCDGRISSQGALVQQLSAQADEVKVVAELNGKKKTFWMDSSSLPEMLVDIHDEVKVSDIAAATDTMVRVCEKEAVDFLRQL